MHRGVCVDSSGNIFIADYSNHAIREVDHTTHNISTVAGDGTGVSGSSGGGHGGGGDGGGSGPTINTVAGTIAQPGSNGDGGPATSAKLNFPMGVYVDSSGNIFIADAGNNAIREVTKSDGKINTIAGTLPPAEAGYSGDSGLATSAKLNYPHGVYVDSSGNIYIADTNNHAIREVR